MQSQHTRFCKELRLTAKPALLGSTGPSTNVKVSQSLRTEKNHRGKARAKEGSRPGGVYVTCLDAISFWVEVERNIVPFLRCG